MLRFFTTFLLVVLLGVSLLRADALDDKLKLLLPDDDQNRQTERQFIRKATLDLVNSLKEDKVDRKSTDKKIELIHERVVMNYLRS